jgi:hypothetical protein
MAVEVLVPLIVFSTPVLIIFINKYFKLREKEIEAGRGNPRLLEGVRSEYEAKQRELEARIENLESALIAMDDQLEPRLAAGKKKPALPASSSPGPGRSLPASSAKDDDTSR